MKTSIADVVADAAWRAKLMRVVDALKAAYDDARDNYSSDKGSNGLTFGVDVSQFARKQVGESAALKRVGSDPFRLLVAGVPTALHRVGRDPAAVPGLPRRRHGWPPSVKRQQALPWGEDVPRFDDVLVLAHAGNEVRGFSALYLCRPVVDEIGTLVQWGEAELIHAELSDGDSLPAPRLESPKPPEEKSAPARVSRRSKA